MNLTEAQKAAVSAVNDAVAHCGDVGFVFRRRSLADGFVFVLLAPPEALRLTEPNTDGEVDR
jgi:hypothetical protein